MIKRFSKGDLVVFLGAGASKPLELPTVREFLPRCLKLEPSWRDTISECISSLQARLDDSFRLEVESIDNCNSERLFTEFYRLSRDPTAIPSNGWAGRSPKEVLAFLERMTQEIYYKEPYNRGLFLETERFASHVSLFETALQYCEASSRSCHIFTTNYDCLVEWTFRHHLRRELFDGFDRSSWGEQFCNFALPQLPSDKPLVALWKIHGSANWLVRLFKEEDGRLTHQVIRLGATPPVTSSHISKLVSEGIFMVPFGDKGYPSDALRSNSYARLKEALRSSDIWISIGFRYADPAILQVFADELQGGSSVGRPIHWLITLKGADDFLKYTQPFEPVVQIFPESFWPCPVGFGTSPEKTMGGFHGIEAYCSALLTGDSTLETWTEMLELRKEILKKLTRQSTNTPFHLTVEPGGVDPVPCILPQPGKLIIDVQQHSESLWDIIFVFDSTAISESGHSYYGEYAKGKLVEALAGATDCKTGNWDLHSAPLKNAYVGDLLQPGGIEIFQTWDRIGSYGVDTRCLRKPIEGIPYAIALGSVPRIVINKADETLRASELTEYHGFVLIEQGALIQMSFELGLVEFPQLVSLWREAVPCFWMKQ